MTLMSAPQSTWCAGSYPCFRARCASGLGVVDAKIRSSEGSALKIDIREPQAHIEPLERRYPELTKGGPRRA